MTCHTLHDYLEKIKCLIYNMSQKIISGTTENSKNHGFSRIYNRNICVKSGAISKLKK